MDEIKYEYKVIYDNGKPYEEQYINAQQLEAGLRKFYEDNKDSDYDFDVTVLDDKDEDIGESQWIQEIVADILDPDGYVEFDYKCPKCKSDDIDFGIIKIEDSNQQSQGVTCNKCNHDFKIWSTTKWEIGKEEYKRGD